MCFVTGVGAERWRLEGGRESVAGWSETYERERERKKEGEGRREERVELGSVFVLG